MLDKCKLNMTSSLNKDIVILYRKIVNSFQGDLLIL